MVDQPYMTGYFYKSTVFWWAFRQAKIQLDEKKYPAILAGQLSNKVFIIQLLSSHLHKVFIVLSHSLKNRSILFSWFVEIHCIVSILLENRFVHSWLWLAVGCTRITSFSRLFRTRAHIHANTSLSLSFQVIDEMNHSVELRLVL